MANRQLNAVVALRAVATPIFDPDHDQNLAEVLSLFRDSALDAKDPDRVKSLVTVWPLAQEVAHFINDHMEFLMQCRLNQEIEKAMKAVVALDDTNPNIRLAGKDFKDSQILPLHPSLLEETSGNGDIIAENNRTPTPQIEDITDVAVDEAGSSEFDAHEAQKTAAKAHQKEKKTRAKLNRKLKKEQEESIEQAELEKRQQQEQDVESAKQIEIAQMLTVAREAHDAQLAYDLDVAQKQQELDNMIAKNSQRAEFSKHAAIALAQHKAKQAEEQKVANEAEVSKQHFPRERMAKNAKVDKQAEEVAQAEIVRKPRIALDAKGQSASQKAVDEFAKRDKLTKNEQHAATETEVIQDEMAQKAELLHKQQAVQRAEMTKAAEIAKTQKEADEAELITQNHLDADSEAETARMEENIKQKQLADAASFANMQKSQESEAVKEAELAKKRQTELVEQQQVARDAELVEAAKISKKRPALSPTKVASKKKTELEAAMVKKADLVKKKESVKAASPSPKNYITPQSRRPVPDSAFPASLQRQKVTTVAKRRQAAAENVHSSSTESKSSPPNIASTKQFPALSATTTSPKRAEGATKVTLSFSKTAVTGLAPKVESTTQFPTLDSGNTTPSKRNDSFAKAPLSYSEVAVTAPPPTVASTSPELESSMEVANTDVSDGASGRSSQKKVVVPRRSDVPHQKCTANDASGKPSLSPSTAILSGMSVQSPSALTTESSPLEVAQTRIKVGKIERRNSIKFIRSRTSSRATVLQSPLAGPSSQASPGPMNGLELPCPAIAEKSTKSANKKPQPSTATGGARGPLAIAPWAADSWRTPVPASASGFYRDESAPVFMVDEPSPGDEHNEFEHQSQKASKTNFPFHRLAFGDVHVWAATYPNDMVAVDDRAVRIKCVSKYILERSQERYPGGEIAKFPYPYYHDAGVSEAQVHFVLPENRGNRGRSNSVAWYAETHYDPEYIPGGLQLPWKLERPIRRNLSVNNLWKMTLPGFDLAGLGPVHF